MTLPDVVTRAHPMVEVHVTDYEMAVALGGCVIAFAILGAIVAWITQPR